METTHYYAGAYGLGVLLGVDLRTLAVAAAASCVADPTAALHLALGGLFRQALLPPTVRRFQSLLCDR